MHRVLSGALGLVLCAVLLGFVVFAAIAMRAPRAELPNADGIVVLTGGDLRIREGARLLRDGRGRRLFITGVNRVTGRKDLLRLSGLRPPQFDCCVDIGYQARDTVGNADETREWASGRGFRRLIVVTASYHMPRSLAELSLAMPDVEFIAHPVRPRQFEQGPWWLDWSAFRVLAGEYLKFLPVAAHVTVVRLGKRWQDSSYAERGSARTRT